ncbi:glycerophosphodiester phosphodiesterase family protein [Candidatus Spongiihabitans sp.]|uniref:glycerophosphodiester phosphodiesterase family protein n=1 Tax=Candidatus Spongiihabitans sp. TaxID=3101308 RepID=UPI003C704228
MTTQNKPAIHGHRGARGRRPENTLPAIEYALQHAVDGVEVDLCVTADDHIVLHHDLVLNPSKTRNSRGEWIKRKWIRNRTPIRSLSLEQLRQYDVGQLKSGTQYAKMFSKQTPVDGASPPTLDECIELIREYSNVILNLEMKSKPGRPCWTPEPEHYVSLVLKKLDDLSFPLARVFLQSFDWRLMHLLKQRQPDLKIGFTKKHPYKSADLNKAKDAGAGVWSCDYRGLTKPLAREAHSLGLEVYAWTVNEERDIKRMAKLDVDTIITDYPERCRAVLGDE